MMETELAIQLLFSRTVALKFRPIRFDDAEKNVARTAWNPGLYENRNILPLPGRGSLHVHLRLVTARNDSRSS